MKSFQAVIFFILLKRAFAQNYTIRNETTKPESIKNHPESIGTAERSKPSRRDFEQRSLVQGILSNSNLSYYAPYWKGGEHVYLHTTKNPGQWPTSVKYFKPFSGPTDKPTPAYSGREPDRYRDCYRDCPRIYHYNYGRVCGFRFNTSYKIWYNEFKEFENMCTLEQENCKTPGVRPNWQAWHRGACRENLVFPHNPTHAPEIKDRAYHWQKDLDEPQLHPFYAHPYPGIKNN